MPYTREQTRVLIQTIRPVDELEEQHINEVLNWIDSGAGLYRITKPDIPPKHLVSYFVPVDPVARKILLIDHILAQMWLPPGGHVEPDEDPAVTATRESEEELGLVAKFLPQLGRQPLLLTQTTTVGLTAGHVDVSLWYVTLGDSRVNYSFDSRECIAVHWFSFDEALTLPPERAEPHIRRFVTKLQSIL